MTFNLTANNYTVAASGSNITINKMNEAKVRAAMADAIKVDGNNVQALASSLGVDATQFNHYCLWYESTKHGNKDGKLDETELAKAIINLDKADGTFNGGFTGKMKASVEWANTEYLKTHSAVALPDEAPVTPPAPVAPEEPETPAPEEEVPEEAVAAKPTLLDTLRGRTGKLLALLLGGAALAVGIQQYRANQMQMPQQGPVYSNVPPNQGLNQGLFGRHPFNAYS
jgi:hypothetical protein